MAAFAEMGGEPAESASAVAQRCDHIILAMGKQAGATLPLSALHRQLLEHAEAAGYGDADNSAILTVFE